VDDIASGPNVSTDYFRRPVGRDSEAKRQRIEVREDGLKIIADDDGLFADCPLDGPDLNPWDQEADFQLHQRGQEALERGVQAAELIRHARSRSHTFSKGQK